MYNFKSQIIQPFTIISITNYTKAEL